MDIENLIRARIWYFVGLVLAATAPALAMPALQAPCPVEWAGIPLKHALSELSGRLGLPYMLDDSVPPEHLDTPVRLSALHLNGRQAFGWLARSVGLEAAVVDGTVLLAPRNRLPRTWRAAIGPGAHPDRGPDRWRTASTRIISVEWLDVPLTRVARDLQLKLGIDVIFAPAIQEQGDLIRLEAADVATETVIRQLTDKLQARADFLDGALWVHPSDHPTPTLPRTPTSSPAPVDSTPASIMDRPIRLDSPINNWTGFADVLAENIGARPQIEIPARTTAPNIQAAGSIADILEAARLMGWITWQVGPSPNQNALLLNIRVRKNDD